jgi:hypothetical protein
MHVHMSSRNLNFWHNFGKVLEFQIHPLENQLVHADGRTGMRDMRKRLKRIKSLGRQVIHISSDIATSEESL